MDDSRLIYFRFWHSSSSAISTFGRWSVTNPFRVSASGHVGFIPTYHNGTTTGRYRTRPRTCSSSFHAFVSQAGGWAKSASRRGR